MRDNYQNRQTNNKDNIPEAAAAPVEETAPVEPTAPAKRPDAIAVVTGCVKLNVRRRPRVDADIVTKIPVNSEVMVDLNGSTAQFYKVCTAAGIEGFCMKQYITIRP